LAGAFFGAVFFAATFLATGFRARLLAAVFAEVLIFFAGARLEAVFFAALVSVAAFFVFFFSV
jgi:hypothetical protein